MASKSGTARFRLKKGELFVEAQAVSGAPGAACRVSQPVRRSARLLRGRHPLRRPQGAARTGSSLPSENFLLHFTGKQDAIVMAVFENRAQDVRVTLAGKGDERAITGSEIDFGKKGSKIWVAVLEGAGLWHAVDVEPRGRQEDHAARRGRCPSSPSGAWTSPARTA